MAIAHIVSGQVVDLHPLGSQLGEARSTALFKTDGLEVMRLVMPAGKSMPPHAVKGEITLHCLEGEVAITADGKPCKLTAGQLLWLEGGMQHALTAVQDSSLLLTVVLRK